MKLSEFKKKYPEYADVDDATLANRLYQKFYADRISFDEFAKKIGYDYTSKTERQKLAELSSAPLHPRPLSELAREADPLGGGLSNLPQMGKGALDVLSTLAVGAAAWPASKVGKYGMWLYKGLLSPESSTLEQKLSAELSGQPVAGPSEADIIASGKKFESEISQIPAVWAQGSPAAETTLRVMGAPFSWLESGLSKGAKATGLPPMVQEIAKDALEVVIFSLAPEVAKKISRAAIKKMAPTYYRMMIPDRRLALQSLEETLRKNPEMSEGEILRKWDNPTWRKEALSKRITPEGEVTPASEPAVQPTGPEAQLPPGQGFQLYTKPYSRATLRKGLPKGSIAPQLPPGQGFVIYPDEFARAILKKALPEAEVPKALPPGQTFELQGKPYTPVPEKPPGPAEKSAQVFQKFIQTVQSPKGAELLKSLLKRLEEESSAKKQPPKESQIKEKALTVIKKEKPQQSLSGNGKKIAGGISRTEIEKTLNSQAPGHDFRFEAYKKPGSGYAPEGYSFHATNKKSPIYGSTIAIPDLKPSTIKSEIESRIKLFEASKEKRPITKEQKQKPIEKIEKKQPATGTLTPKQQKEPLLQEIDRAIERAPGKYPEIARREPLRPGSTKEKVVGPERAFITIKVPGDGEFKLLNHKETLKQFKNQAKKFPVSVPRPKGKGKSSPKSTGRRIIGANVEYYNQFAPKKLPKSKVVIKNPTDERFQYYSDGLYSNAQYAIKVPKDRTSGINISSEKRNLSEMVNKFSKGAKQAKIIAEFKPLNVKDTVYVHIKRGKNDIILDAKYVDAIMSEHPGAVPFGKTANDPVVFKVGDEVVGAVGPVEFDPSGLKAVIAKRTKPIPETSGKSTLTNDLKKNILNNKGQVDIDIEALKKGIKDLKIDLPKEDTNLLGLYGGLPFWMAKWHPETIGKIQEVIQNRFNNKNIIRNNYAKALYDAWDGLTDKEIKRLNKIFWMGDEKGAWLNENGLAKLTPRERRAYETWKDISQFILLEERPALMREYGAAKTDIEEYMREAGKIKGYMPHYRDGRFSVIATSKTGERLYREAFNDLILNITKRTPGMPELGPKALSKRHRIEKMFDDAVVKIIENQQLFPEDGYFDVSPQVTQELLNAAIKLTDATPEERVELQKLWERAAADVFHLRGFGKHFLKRRGTPGYTKMDFREAQLRYISGWAGYKAKIIAARQLRDTWGKLDWTNKERLRKYADRQVRDTFQNMDAVDRAVDTARALLFRQFLGFRVKSAILNLTQNFLAFVPAISPHTRWATAKIVKEMTMAARDIARAKFGGTKGRLLQKAGRLDAETMKALLRAREDGTVAAQMTEELAGKRFGKYDSALRAIDNASSWMFNQSEVAANREPAFVVAFRVARKEKGMTFEEAYRFAKDIVGKSHFEYGRHNLPPYARGRMKVLRAFYAFRHYTNNLAHLWIDLWRSGLRGKLGVLKSFGALLFFGGIVSLPLIKTISALYTKATGKDLYNEIAEKAGRWFVYVMYGAPALVGFELSGSIGTDIPVSIPEVFGAPATWGQKSIRSYEDLEKGDTYRAIEDFPFMPSVGRDVLSGYRLSTRGATKPSGRPIFDSDFKRLKLTKKERALQFFGMRPIKLTESYRRYKSQSRIVDFWQSKRTLLYDKLRIAVDKHGARSTEVKKIRSQIRDFNKTKPAFVSPIKATDIRRALITRPTRRQYMLNKAIK